MIFYDSSPREGYEYATFSKLISDTSNEQLTKMM